MTDADRELLEAAAKAAGITVNIVGDGIPGGAVTFYSLPGNLFWNPLNDDGDAMRLAANRHLVVDFFEGEVIGESKVVKFDVHDIASARRAIVRAAASMSPAPAGGREGVR